MPPIARNAKPRRPGAIAFIGLLLVLAVAVLIVGNSVFVIKSITVQGNRFCAKEEVLASAGLSLGMGMFSIDTGKVRDGVNANRYLKYVGLWRDFPSHVTLRVEEHAPRATLTSGGMLVMIGENSTVLEESAYIDLVLQVPTITGAQVDRVRVGYPLVYSQAGQGEAVEEVLGLLEALGAAGEASELNVSALDNLYLVTDDGLQVVLGDTKDMRQKISLMLMLLPTLRETEEVRGGILDMTSGVAGDFRPPKREN